MAPGADPIAYVKELLRRAEHKGEPERGTAMALATATPNGRPSLRMVLLKGLDERGFVFYTNYGSRKAAELEANPHAAIDLFWNSLQVQVRAEGAVERVSAEEADAYFASRPRQSQLGAWASLQSQPLSGRGELIARYLQEKGRRLGRKVPRPPHWGGYRLRPHRIELWIGKIGRLHDRYLYERQDDGAWRRSLLFP